MASTDIKSAGSYRNFQRVRSLSRVTDVPEIFFVPLSLTELVILI